MLDTQLNVQQKALSPAAAILLYVSVAVCGAAVMIYEFIAVRFLQRFVGGSLDVWAAEISICLAGLALGYALGGWIADRWHAWFPLGLVVAVAGASAFPMEQLVFFADYIAPKGETVGWWEPLFYAGISTFVPLLSLGTVMPQAIRLHVRRIDRVGSGAGWISMLSTGGSIAGALLTAMVFIPWGVRESLYATSAVLAILGVLLMSFAIITRHPSRVAALLIVFSGVSAAHAEVIYEDYSAYHHILVADEGERRVLYFDDSPQTTMAIADPHSGGFEYTDFFHVPFLLNPTMQSALFVGLGGGTGPKNFLHSYPMLKIEVAEIDPAVVRVAQRFFGLPDDARLRVMTTDGRTYVQRTKQTYGIIVLDAYGSGPNGAYLPYHLVTLEFFKSVYDRLENGGCIVYNVMGTFGGSNDDIVRGMMTTLEDVFQAVYAFEAKSSYNTVYVAQKIVPSKLAADGTRDGLAWPRGPWFAHPTDLSQLASNLIQSGGPYLPQQLAARVQQFSVVQTAPRNGTIYTDNNAPVDLAPNRR